MCRGGKSLSQELGGPATPQDNLPHSPEGPPLKALGPMEVIHLPSGVTEVQGITGRLLRGVVLVIPTSLQQLGLHSSKATASSSQEDTT